jgi:hypothetical protein
MSQTTTILHRCPKCGYDQSGIIDSWTDHCPLDGRCAECGLEFEWSIVMDPSREDLFWYSEHGRTMRSAVLRTPTTVAMMLLPYRFWHGVTVLADVRLKALAAWAFVLLLSMHLLTSIPVAVGYWRDTAGWNYVSFFEYLEVQGVLGGLAFVFNGIFTEIAFLEFDRAGRLVLNIFSTNYHTGLEGGFVIPLAFAGMILTWLLVLLVVPTTRRMAKLRSPHILRAGLLSLLVAGTVYELFRCFVGSLMWAGIFPKWAGPVVLVFCVFVAVWMLVFWATAVRIGWCIRPSWLLIVLGTIASALGGLVAVFMPILFT